MKIIATVVLAFVANLYNNIIDGFCHKLVYPYKAPALLKSKNWAQMESGEGAPIIFVHGRGARYSSCYSLYKNMKAHGSKRPMYAIQVHDNKKLGIDDCANQVSKAIKHILEERGDNQEEICLIGHSYGGVQITKVALQNEFNIKQIVTIASPMQGTAAANCLLAPTIVKENLSPQCDEIRKLNDELAELPSGAFDIHHLTSYWDFIVFPKDVMSSRASNLTCWRYTGSHGHAGLVDDPDVAKWIFHLHQ